MKQQNLMPSYASIHAKPLFYRINGTGRDTYIEFNNGGLTTENQSSKFPAIGNTGRMTM